MSQSKDLEYLFSPSVGRIVAEGLTVLYESKPQHPVTFLAEWLLNHCNEEKNNVLNKEAESLAVVLREKLTAKINEKEKEERTHQIIEKREAQLEENFRKKVGEHLYLEELLDHDLPDHIAERKKLPNVYIGVVQYPTKPINENDDDPDAHLDKERGKVITYIGASQNQRFMIGKQLLPETGVTYEVFKPLEEQPEEGAVEDKPRNKYISDITQEKAMVFFKIPRLGAYFGVSLAYKSVLHDAAFDEGVKERIRVTQEKEVQNEQKEKEEAEYLQNLEEAENEGRDTQAIEEAWRSKEWPVIEEKEFESILKEFVLVVDTMGEDREITIEERKYVKELAQYFIDSWEKSEKTQLSNDIDSQIRLNKDFVKEEFIEALNSRIEEEVNDKLNSDDVPEGESELRANTRKLGHQAEAYRAAFLDEEFSSKVAALKDYRVIKFPGIIQEAFILAGYTREEINLPGTNILDWKTMKNSLTKEKFFDKLAAYQFRGAKPDRPPKYALITRISKRISAFSNEEVDPYNAGLGVLLRFIRTVAEARILDIQARKELKNLARQKRGQLIEEEAARIQKRDQYINETREKWDQEEPFNEEAVLKEWEEDPDNQPIEIPPQVIDDIDEDIEKEEAA